MRSREIEIANPSGLHTRPGTRFVRQAKQFACQVTVRRGGQASNGKSLLRLMKLGVCQGDTITLECDGLDEGEAVAALSALVESLEE